ncbi:MAG: hypothetical protein ABI746_11055 [Dermatophilaceae bacterium]
MPTTVKRVFIWVFWIFVVYALFTSPDQVATIIRNAWSTIVTAVTSLGIFFDRVMGR